ncbi:MAG: FprA family A-type flavoprotein [Desulfomonile tiedjei]|uniref:FprA family A-type flavoprotein n=1 Tax=Desulfomonile tiedjei TaxID=2358 RepID=A0A9D6V400_9BACT|nr:FprA family A-type flavoprotein [Desulfomonile tiedjei]
MFEAAELRDDIFWVGAIDWDIREFHGYTTNRGTTYNAYLVKGEKTALIDTVKAGFFPEMISRIRSVQDPAKIDYLVLNHLEMDHSGSVPLFKELAPNAQIVATDHGSKGLPRHFRYDWPVHKVKTGAEISLGDKTLQFIEAYMLHWPDSMFTYLKEDSVLLPNDGFGQHYASFHRFDDEDGRIEAIMEEAAKYFANILMPLAPLIPPLLKKVEKMGLKIEMIAPSHGIIWRSHINKIISSYVEWSTGVARDRVLVIYDTMWGSTEAMARAISEGLNSAQVEHKLIHLRKNHYSDVLGEILTAKALVIGSPTINEGMFPSVAQLLYYIKGLHPLKKKGVAFGSYGWGGEAIEAINGEMRASGIEILEPGLGITYVPGKEDLEECVLLGKRIAEAVRK